MNFDKPLQVDTNIKNYSVPEITTEKFRDEYLKTFNETVKGIYAIGKSFESIDKELENNKEYDRVDQEIQRLRSEYITKYENEENVNLSDENWRAERDEALKNLRMAEFNAIRFSKLDNISKNKFASTSNMYFREKGVKNTLVYGEYTRQMNITNATTKINDNIELLSMTDNESEREQLLNSINNQKAMLLKYGINENELNSNLLRNINDSLKVSTKNQIDNLFLTTNPDTAVAQANQIILSNSQKYTAMIGKIDGMSSDDAYKLMESYYKDHKTFFGKYINSQKKRVKDNAEKQKKVYEADISSAINLLNPQKLGILTLGYKFGTKDFLNNNNEVLRKMTNTDIENFYDIDSPEVFPVLTSDYFSAISTDIKELKKNGYSGREALQPLYTMAKDLSDGNLDKKVMVLKHYGKKTGLNPYALLKGEEDPDYIEAAEGMNAGKNYVNNYKYLPDIEILGRNAIKRLETLSYNFSESNGVIGYDRAVKLVIGMLYKDENTRKDIENDPDLAIREILNDDEKFNYLFEISKKAAEFETKRLEYNYSKLKDPRIEYSEPKKINNEIDREKDKRIIENSKGW